jgi:hypothetical protein
MGMTVVGHRAMYPKKRKVYGRPDRPVLNLFPTDAGDGIDLQDRKLGLSCVGWDGDEDGRPLWDEYSAIYGWSGPADQTNNCIYRPVLCNTATTV